MTRKEFIKMCAVLGIGLPLQASSMPISTNTKPQVIVIGAGAAGMATAYLLKQQGIDAVVLEASEYIGGRMKRTTDFADFPIPLGAEWIHAYPGIMQELVNDDQKTVTIQTTSYDPAKDYGLYDGERISLAEAGFKHEHKFINATWFDFFESYIYPAINDQISFNAVVESINYEEDQVVVKTKNQKYSADQVVVTVPLKILQMGKITFIPALPKIKRKAIEKATVWDGCKAFIEFDKSFYPAFTEFEIRPNYAGEKLFYDAAYGQQTSKHILGLFAVGTGAQPYLEMDDEQLISTILAELDRLFDNQATDSYIKHTFQNWNEEPHIRGAYLYDHESFLRVKILGQSVTDKVYFAGEAYTNGLNWGSVDAAIASAQRVVRRLV